MHEVQMCSRIYNLGNPVYSICLFVDYENAFDGVDWFKLMKILQKTGINWRDRRLLWNLHRVSKKLCIFVSVRTLSNFHQL